MDQRKRAGHHAITKVAVAELFESGRADARGRIAGLNEADYFSALDAAQLYQDRWYGPTVDPAWFNPDAQREHAMADPDRTGAENLRRNREFVADQLYAARFGREMKHLGAAVHALEDSYSEAHAFRTDDANSGDPTAPIEAFNVVDPLPNWSMRSWGMFGHEEGTHDSRFDRVPIAPDGTLVRGTDIAAARAVARILTTYEDNRTEPEAAARTALEAAVEPYFQPSAGGVAVNDRVTKTWRAERDRRLGIHRDEMAKANVRRRAGAATWTERAVGSVRTGATFVIAVTESARRFGRWRTKS